MRLKHCLLGLIALQAFLPSAAQDAATKLPLSQGGGLRTGTPQERCTCISTTCYFLGGTIWYKGYVTQGDKGDAHHTKAESSTLDLLTPDGYLVEQQQLKMPNGMTLRHVRFGRLAFMPDTTNCGPIPGGCSTSDNVNIRTLQKPRQLFIAKDGQRVFSGTSRNSTPGTNGRVAFEANTAEGQHIDVELSIRDSKGREVARSKVFHRGRGTFGLPAIPAGEKYKAVFQYQGYDYTVPLPEPAKEGCAMQVDNTGEALRIAVQAAGLATPTPALGLQVMSGGVSKGFYDIRPDGAGKAVVEVPLSQLPTGVNQITLFDGKGRIYADRLVFVNHHDYDQPQMDISGIKPQYEPFEPIALQLQLKDPQATAPNVSLAVRDHATDELTYDNGNILTEMLLGSELKGFVEDPGFYFEQDDSLRTQSLDLPRPLPGASTGPRTLIPTSRNPATCAGGERMGHVRAGRTDAGTATATENGTFYMQTPRGRQAVLPHVKGQGISLHAKGARRKRLEEHDQQTGITLCGRHGNAQRILPADALGRETAANQGCRTVHSPKKSPRIGSQWTSPPPMAGGAKTQDKYRKATSWTNSIFTPTTHPCEQASSWKYEQDNQPEFIVDYRLKPQ